jgi:S-adenosylmethionine:tRNA ribosyltransferase-isomerase
VDVAAFDFELPSELIAQQPSRERDEARLMRLDRVTGARTHHRVGDLPDLLVPGDLLVVNDTAVIPARLFGERVPTGGAVECLLLERLDGDEWDALVHPGQKLRVGERIRFDANGRVLHGEIIRRASFGRRTVGLWTEDGQTVDSTIDAIGHVPLPPYIKRADREDDRERYQTVYARHRGSVAAPTAGLHFTPAMLARLRARGVEIAPITLHVGYGTFKPVRVERVEDHAVDAETFSIDEAAADAIRRARAAGRRVVAVGTTTTRALEGVAKANGEIVAASGRTDLFIYPGFTFRAIDGLLTNFHLPRSSLLMLVSAFAGRERVLDAYGEAVAAGYRFYSYGDAMLILGPVRG